MTQNRFGLKFSQIKLLILSLFGASWYQPPGRNLAELTSEIGLLRSQLQKIKCMHKGNNPPPSVHVLGDFNFGDIVWPDRLNKSGSPLSTSEGETLIEIMNDYGLEQLLEQIVCSNIMAHLDEHRLLSEKQHAFRKWHSCETQLITVIDDWAKILDNQGQVDTFILDFEKAFDAPLMNFSKASCVWCPAGHRSLSPVVFSAHK